MNTIPTSLVFQYAIKFPDGQYYTGPNWLINDHTGKHRTRVDKSENRGPAHKAYTYTELRAHAIVRGNRTVFDGCTIERVL